MIQDIALDRNIDAALARHGHVAISISGGADSTACALAVSSYLDSIGHPHSRRILIHADLGRIEWRSTTPFCEQLASHLDIPLITVARRKGDMIARWRQRWDDGRRRYADLATVKLIGPWSSAANRFCTSELKRGPLFSKLGTLWTDTVILS